MQNGIGRLLSPSQEWWIWLAGLICVILLVQFYDPTSITSESQEDLPVTTPLPATAAAALLPTPTRPLAATRLPGSTPTVRPTATATATPAPVFYAVQPGDMPLSIAYEYDVDVEALLKANDIEDPTTLQIGQKLLIPVTPTPGSPPPSATPTRRVTPTPGPTLVFHTVVEGDTLLAIAYNYDTTVEAIAAANWLNNPHSLQIGQKLVVPPEDGSLPDPLLWAPRIVHDVRPGDTFIAIAQRYGSTVEHLVEVNPNLNPNLLSIGQEVVVPLTRQPESRPGQPGGSAGLSEAARLSLAELASLKSGSPSLADMEQAMLRVVNAERQARNLPPYTVDQQLTLMAWERAQDMATRNYMSHVTPEGETLRARFRAMGWSTPYVSENIYLSTQPASQAVERTMSWFMGDPPHRAGIVSSSYNRIGVGVAQNRSGWYIFVQVFAQK